MNLKTFFYLVLFLLLSIGSILAFLFSCIVTLSDGQGALIFIFTIPAIIILLIISWLLAREIKKKREIKFPLPALPKFLFIFYMSFFTLSFVPYLNKIPNSFLGLVGVVFEKTVGNTPYVFFKERKAFPNLLLQSLESSPQASIDFSKLEVTYAWDKLCIFGPYTNSAKAKSILGLNWNIEDRSQVYTSDSINALVFLFEGKVNQVVDLKRGIVDFADINICIERNQAIFSNRIDTNGRRILKRNI